MTNVRGALSNKSGGNGTVRRDVQRTSNEGKERKHVAKARGGLDHGTADRSRKKKLRGVSLYSSRSSEWGFVHGAFIVAARNADSVRPLQSRTIRAGNNRRVEQRSSVYQTVRTVLLWFVQTSQRIERVHVDTRWTGSISPALNYFPV